MYFQGKLDASVPYRTYSLLTFIRRNAIHANQLFELKISLAKRNASIYITPKFGARFKLVAPNDFQRVHNKKSVIILIIFNGSHWQPRELLTAIPRHQVTLAWLQRRKWCLKVWKQKRIKTFFCIQKLNFINLGQNYDICGS